MKRYAGSISFSEQRLDEGTGQTYTVVNQLSESFSPDPWTVLRKDVLTDEQCQPWLLPAIFEQVTEGSNAFLSEFRQVATLFLNFTGIDYDQDDQAEVKLDGFIHWVQSVVAQYEGSLMQLTMGDKGSYLYAAFGAPTAHNDDAVRAVYAALTLQEIPPDFEWIEAIKIGISLGKTWAGAYGSSTRRIYGVQGDKVNLAARLMQSANQGILCDESVYQATQGRLVFESLPPVEVKGLQERVSVYRPTGEKRRLDRKRAKFIGRTGDRIALGRILSDVKHGQNKLVLIEGEPGIGKTRLVEVVQEMADKYEIDHYQVDETVGDHNIPFQAWRDIFWHLFDLGGSDSNAAREDQLQKASNISADDPHFRSAIRMILPSLVIDNENLESLEEGDFPEQTRRLLIELLRVGLKESPTILIFENSQDLDQASWGLIQDASTQIDSLGIIIVARPLGEPLTPGYAQLLRMPNLKILRMSGLSADESYLLACDHLGVVNLQDELVDILGKAGGNPQFIEEMVYSLRDDGYVILKDGECQVLPHVDLGEIIFPTTSDGLIKSRLDRLSPSEQLTLKVGSVIGQTFSMQALREIYPFEADEPFLDKHIEALSDLGLIIPTSQDSSYTFRDEITHETVYNAMLFSQRRQLHRQIAEWLEGYYSEDLSPYYAILAEHWRNADDTAKAIDYLEMAGKKAVQAGNYEEAEVYFRQCLELDSTAAVLSAEFFEKKLKQEESSS